MRHLIIAALYCFACAALAQPELKVSQLAELAQGLSRPHDAAFSPDGKRLYVTDMSNSRIAVVDAASLALEGYFGEGQLSYPHDAEFDGGGRLLVADTGNGRIAIYRVDGASGVLVGELGGLAAPEGVAVLADGRIAATNTRTGTLSLFRDGKLVASAGAYGSGEGEMVRPHDIDAADDGRLYVVDSGNHRVQVFDADLRHRATLGTALGLNEPKYLSLDGDGLWLADEYNHRILWLDRELKLRGVLGGPRGRAANAFNKPEAVLARAPDLWVIDTYNDRIVRLRVE